MLKKLLILHLLLATASLTACCDCRGRAGGVDLSKLPPPISVEEQIRLLNTRAAQLPNLIAHIDLLEFRSLDDKSKEHREHAEGGRLFIRQHLDNTNAADIHLTGTVFGNSELDLGKNDNQFWYAIYANIKEAHIGDTHATPNFTGSEKDLFRADLHLQMLALGQILPASDKVIALQVDDTTAKNRLFIERITSTGLAQMDRQLTIDRFTGRVEEVDLYDAKGSLLARSQLTDYVQVEYRGAPAPTSTPPAVPTTINIDFPTLKSSITLKLAGPFVPPSIEDSQFQPKDFQSEGLKVLPIQ